MTYSLVYQSGLANVFGPDSKRILQGAYSTCEDFCRGLMHCGNHVEVLHCDMAGDCAIALGILAPVHFS